MHDKDKLFERAVFFIDAVLLLLYSYILFSKPFLLHPEIALTFDPMVEAGKGFIAKIFNMCIIEQGLYRPRLVCFIIHYVDCNFMMFLSHFTNKFILLFSFFSGYIYVGALYLLFKRLLPNTKKAYLLLFSILPIFTHAWLTSTMTLCRSSKLLTPAVVVVVYNFWLKHKDEEKQPAWKTAAYALLLFAGMLMDEQVILFSAFLLGYSILLRAIKKIRAENAVSVPAAGKPVMAVLGIASVLYVFWHKVLGRILFSKFTPMVMQPHRHQFSQPFTNMSLSLILNSLSVWLEAMNAFFTPITFVAALLICFFLIYSKKAKDKEKIFNSLALVVCSVLIIYSCCSAHSPIYRYRDLPYGFYFLSASVLCYIAVVSIIGSSDIFKNNLSEKLIGVAFAVMLVMNITHINTYYMTHVCETGHLTISTDRMEILDKNGIKDYILLKSKPPTFRKLFGEEENR